MANSHEPLSIHDIAQMAGVSASTVSRTLSGRGPVSEQLAERVMNIVRETGYSVNSAASRLSQRRARLPGLVHDTVTLVRVDENEFSKVLVSASNHASVVSQSAGGALEAADRFGISVSLCLLDIAEVESLEPPPKLRRLSTDGFLFQMGGRLNPWGLQSVAPTVGFPAIATPDCCCPTVEADNLLGVFGILSHLAELGHRRLAFVSLSVEGKSPHIPSLERRNAVLQLAKRFDMKPDVYPIADDEIASVASRILSSPAESRPTAVVCAHDGMAARLMNHLAAKGARVPGDFSITGFDGSWASWEADPQITTWHPDWNQLGALALRNLLCAIRGEPVPRRSLVGGELRLGGSTGRPGGGP